MERISGFSLALATFRLKEESQRRFFGLGKPYVLVGRCHAVASHLFQTGGILARKYAFNLDAFGHAFLGATGEPGAVEEFFSTLAEKKVLPLLDDSSKIFEYVWNELISRTSFKGDVGEFLMEVAGQKMDVPLAREIAREFAAYGAALGALYPEKLVALIERTYARVPDEKWQAARRAGLDISEKQIDLNYDDWEAAEDVLFVEYCRECCPNLLSQLTTHVA